MRRGDEIGEERRDGMSRGMGEAKKGRKGSKGEGNGRNGKGRKWKREGGREDTE